MMISYENNPIDCNEINFANNSSPIIPFEHCFGEFEFSGEQLTGLYVEFDVFDTEELSYLYCCTNLQYLRIKIPEHKVSLEEVDAFLMWLSESEKLHFIAFENIPTGSNEIIYHMLLAASVHKNMPVTVVVPEKTISKSYRQKNIQELEIPNTINLQVLSSKIVMTRKTKKHSVILNHSGLMNVLSTGKVLKVFGWKSMTYKGDLDVEGGEWKLSVKKMTINQKMDLILVMEGVDNNGTFNCTSRCEWVSDEGGFYFSPKQPLSYREYPWDDSTVCIKLIHIEFHAKGGVWIKGFWIQKTGGTQQERWAIDGYLTLDHL